jgi:hypothetical protein
VRGEYRVKTLDEIIAAIVDASLKLLARTAGESSAFLRGLRGLRASA